ncbi:metalloregulator ArsR/SmtB family transcription factor [Rickettsiales bacterium]|nr:metalloregulator ArsR/SmtB family transcription factor [Rickettsiales bacterium]
MKLEKASKMLSALAQETRIQIYKLLVQESDDGLSAGSIAEILQIPSATLSFHLSQLTNAGLLKARKDGRTIYYAAKYKAVKKLMKFLNENSFKKREVAAAMNSQLSSSYSQDEENDEDL